MNKTNTKTYKIVLFRSHMSSELEFNQVVAASDVVLIDTCFLFPVIADLAPRYAHLKRNGLPVLLTAGNMNRLNPSIVRIATEDLRTKNSLIEGCPKAKTIADVVQELSGITLRINGQIVGMERLAAKVRDPKRTQLYTENVVAARDYEHTLLSSERVLDERAIKLTEFAAHFASPERNGRCETDRKLHGMAYFFASQGARCGILTRDSDHLDLLEEVMRKDKKAGKLIAVYFLRGNGFSKF